MFSKTLSQKQKKEIQLIKNNFFYKPFVKTKLYQYYSYRGPHLWNSLVPKTFQNISFDTYKVKIKKCCIKLNNENNYF